MFLKCCSPEAFDNLNKAVYSVSLASVMLSWVRHLDFRHFFRNHMPASKSLFELYIYPMWGELKLTYVKNLSFSSPSKCGSAALIMRPPSEWPIKLTLERQFIGQKDWIYCFTSFARRSPISKISPSVSSSFAPEAKKRASGWASERLFFKSLMSP